MAFNHLFSDFPAAQNDANRSMHGKFFEHGLTTSPAGPSREENFPSSTTHAPKAIHAMVFPKALCMGCGDPNIGDPYPRCFVHLGKCIFCYVDTFAEDVMEGGQWLQRTYEGKTWSILNAIEPFLSKWVDDIFLEFGQALPDAVKEEVEYRVLGLVEDIHARDRGDVFLPSSKDESDWNSLFGVVAPITDIASDGRLSEPGFGVSSRGAFGLTSEQPITLYRLDLAGLIPTSNTSPTIANMQRANTHPVVVDSDSELKPSTMTRFSIENRVRVLKRRRQDLDSPEHVAKKRRYDDLMYESMDISNASSSNRRMIEKLEERKGKSHADVEDRKARGVAYMRRTDEIVREAFNLSPDQKLAKSDSQVQEDIRLEMARLKRALLVKRHAEVKAEVEVLFQ